MDFGVEGEGASVSAIENGRASTLLELLQSADGRPTGRCQEVSVQQLVTDTNPDSADRLQDKTDACLQPWSRDETLVLMEALNAAETIVKRSKDERVMAGEDEKAADGAGHGWWIMESKWFLISAFCKQRGVEREANQCRKWWWNLLGDFHRIREWHKTSLEGFWVMKTDSRKENRLPCSFDPDVFDTMEKLLGNNPESPPQAVSERLRPVFEDAFLPDTEHSIQEDARARNVENPVSLLSGMCEEKSLANLSGCKKRKNSGLVEPLEHKDPLVVLLECSCKQLVSHLETQHHRIQLERANEREQCNSLLSVLGSYWVWSRRLLNSIHFGKSPLPCGSV